MQKWDVSRHRVMLGPQEGPIQAPPGLLGAAVASGNPSVVFGRGNQDPNTIRYTMLGKLPILDDFLVSPIVPHVRKPSFG